MLSYFTITAIALAVFDHAIGARSKITLTVCPPAEDLYPCHCKTIPFDNIEVICKNLATDNSLTRILKLLKGYHVHLLEVSNYNATTVPTDIFEGNSFQNLLIDSFEVADDSFRRGQKHFQGLEKFLHTLQIKNSFKSGERSLDNLELGHLHSLQSVILEDNSITEIGNDWFEKAPELLLMLYIDGNGIEVLGDKAFSTLVNLSALRVTGNQFSDITRSMLPTHATRLIYINFSHNQIRELPKDIFSNMPSLQHVELINNKLHTIQEDVWSTVWSRLHIVNLEGNPLNCDDIQWTCKLKSPELHGMCYLPQEKNGVILQEYCKSQ